MMDKGLTHIYCGEGKGKTTAAFGLALRCAGHGQTVVIAQFLKAGDSGECQAMRRFPNVLLQAVHPVGKFSFQMNAEEKQQTTRALTAFFAEITALAVQRQARLLLLDEIIGAVDKGFLSEETVLAFLRSRPAGLEVVMTGRNPSAALIDCADYVSEIQKIKHPFDRGIAARDCIER